MQNKIGKQYLRFRKYTILYLKCLNINFYILIALLSLPLDNHCPNIALLDRLFQKILKPLQYPHVS